MSRPLHAVFTELVQDEAARQAFAADPDNFLVDAGHAGMSEEMVAEAIVSFAETAAPAVAEHLAPFVMANGSIDATDPGESLDGLELLASAPRDDDDGRDDSAAAPPEPAELAEPPEPAVAHEPSDATDSLNDLDFGSGSDLSTSVPSLETDLAAELDDLPLSAAPEVNLDDERPADQPVANTIDELDQADDAPLE